MTKETFLRLLHEKLAPLPHQEREERLAFYSEMIDDRMEEGLTEEAAVAAVGSVEEIAGQILGESTREPLPPEKDRKNAGKVALLVAGSPLWIALLMAAFGVVISLMVSLWAVVVSLWASVGSVCACVVGGILCTILTMVNGFTASGVFLIGGSFLCAGMTILLFFAARESTKGMNRLTKKLYQWCKTYFFAKKGDAI